MAKPPEAPPHSDIDGVFQDEERNVEAAREAGEDSSNLELAREESHGRPPHSDDQGDLDDRTG